MRKGRKPCSVTGCEVLCHGKGLCKKHWAFQHRYGSLDIRKVTTPNEIIVEGNTAFVQCYDRTGNKTDQLIIDVADIELISKYKWNIPKTPDYGRTSSKGDIKVIYLHRLLMGFPSQKVDHINGNRKDNRRKNLRLVNDFQHAWNSRGSSYIHRSTNGGYVVQITKQKRSYSKTVRTKKEALEWRKILLRQHYGEYSPL